MDERSSEAVSSAGWTRSSHAARTHTPPPCTVPAVSTHHRSGSGEGQRDTEVVACGAVSGGEFGLLADPGVAKAERPAHSNPQPNGGLAESQPRTRCGMRSKLHSAVRCHGRRRDSRRPRRAPSSAPVPRSQPEPATGREKGRFPAHISHWPLRERPHRPSRGVMHRSTIDQIHTPSMAKSHTRDTPDP